MLPSLHKLNLQTVSAYSGESSSDPKLLTQLELEAAFDASTSTVGRGYVASVKLCVVPGYQRPVMVKRSHFHLELGEYGGLGEYERNDVFVAFSREYEQHMTLYRNVVDHCRVFVTQPIPVQLDKKAFVDDESIDHVYIASTSADLFGKGNFATVHYLLSLYFNRSTVQNPNDPLTQQNEEQRKQAAQKRIAILANDADNGQQLYRLGYLQGNAIGCLHTSHVMHRDLTDVNVVLSFPEGDSDMTEFDKCKMCIIDYDKAKYINKDYDVAQFSKPDSWEAWSQPFKDRPQFPSFCLTKAVLGGNAPNSKDEEFVCLEPEQNRNGIIDTLISGFRGNAQCINALVYGYVCGYCSAVKLDAETMLRDKWIVEWPDEYNVREASASKRSKHVTT